MKKIVLSRTRVLLAVPVLAAVGLVGCDGNDDGGPSAPPRPVTTPVAGPTAPPVGNPFAGAFSGTYRATAPNTGEVGTFLITVDSDGDVEGGFSSPFAPAPIAIDSGTVSNAGVLTATADGDFGGGATARITVTAQLRRGPGGLLGTGTFVSVNPGGTVRGTLTADEVTDDEADDFDGRYTGTFINTQNTSQNGTLTATVDSGSVIATITAPGIGTINGRGIVDLSTGQIAFSAPFQFQGQNFFFGAGGRLVRSGNAISGSGNFSSTAGGRGTFQLTRR